MDQLPTCTSYINEYEAIDHGTRELDPTHAIMVEKNHMTSLFDILPESIGIIALFLDRPSLALFSSYVTDIHPNEVHPNLTTRGKNRNHTLPTGHIYPP